jgi:hypothetical protein
MFYFFSSSVSFSAFMSLDGDFEQVQDFSFAISSLNMSIELFHVHISEEFSCFNESNFYIYNKNTVKKIIEIFY